MTAGTFSSGGTDVRAGLPVAVPVEELGNGSCAFEAGSGDPGTLALWLGMLEADFTVIDAPEPVGRPA